MEEERVKPIQRFGWFLLSPKDCWALLECEYAFAQNDKPFAFCYRNTVQYGGKHDGIPLSAMVRHWSEVGGQQERSTITTSEAIYIEPAVVPKEEFSMDGIKALVAMGTIRLPDQSAEMGVQYVNSRINRNGPTGSIQVQTPNKAIAASAGRLEVALVRPDGLIVKVRAIGKRLPVPTGRYHVKAVSLVFEAEADSKPWYFSFFAPTTISDGPMYEVRPGSLVHIAVLEGLQFKSRFVEGPLECHAGDELKVLVQLTSTDGLYLGYFCRHKRWDGSCPRGPDISLLSPDGAILATGLPAG